MWLSYEQCQKIFLAIAEKAEDFSTIFLFGIFSHKLDEMFKFNEYLTYSSFL
jgi:hypothetical protein